MSPPPQQTLRPPATAGPFLFPQTQSTVLPDPSNFFSPNLLSTPLPTNSFFQNFALKNGDQPEYFHPYAVKSSSASLTFCYPSRFSTSAFIYQVFVADLAISAAQKPDSPQPHKISSFNDLSITLDFPSSNLRFFLVRGSPFITCSVSNSTSLSIFTIHAILSCESNGSKTKYTIKLNSNQTWLVYTSSPIDLTTSGLSLITSNGFSGIVRIAILPDSNPKLEASLDRFSSCYPVSGEAVFTKPFVVEYRWEKKGWGDLLMLAHPLHLQLLSGEDSHVTVLEDFKFMFTSERISGRLRLIKHGSSLFMTWIPYNGQNSNARVSEKDRNLYTIRSVPLTEVRSIRRHTPALGWQYIIVVLATGLAFPPLYFYNGGVKEFLAAIKQHVFLVRSAEDANVFLVNDFQNPLQRTLSSLELPRALSVASGQSTLVSVGENSSDENQERTSGYVQDGSLSISQYNERQRQRVHDPARDLSIQVLEKFSLVTKFARETTSQLFRDNHSNGYGAIERRSNNQSPIDYPQKASHDSNRAPEKSPVPPDSLEFDKESMVWGKPRQPPLGSDEWEAFFDSEGRIIYSEAFRKRIFYGGVEHKLRKEVWPFLLGYHAFDSTDAEREYLRAVKKSEFETIKKQWQSISPEQAKRFTKFRERKGLIEKDVVRTDRSLSYYDGDDNPNVNLLRDILLTYSFYNFDLGYCQGMSDLLSPILYVMEDESESFWCFVSLMERLGPNFNRDQSGMHSQLFAVTKLVELLDVPLHNHFTQKDCLNYFFCFRWVLIQFKREFEFDKTMRLWEILWTHYPSEHLHLYVCVAILKRHRSKIIGEQMDFDTLLKFINELSGHIDLDAVVRDAEALCICAGENGAASIPPGTPPSLPVDDVLLYPQQELDDIL